MLSRLDAPPSRPSGHGARARSLAAHGMLVAGSALAFALALAAAEGLSRWWDPGYLVRVRGLHVYSPHYGWAGRPSAAAPMGDGHATLNARGFRGRELPVPKTGRGRRVVVLGDSVAFGYGVSDEQVFARLIDVRDNGVDAANLGVQGYGPGQELLLLRREGLRHEPDVVLLVFCLRNDFVDAVLPVDLYNGRTPRPVFRLEAGRLVLDDAPVRRSALARLAGGLADQSHLLNRAVSVRPGPGAEPERDWRHRKQEALRDPDSVLRLNVALVLEMDRLCRERRVAFLVATFPSGLSYERETEIVSGFHRALAAAGVATVDMAERFRAAGATPAELAADRTGHLSVRGHALAAEILERELLAIAL